MEASAPGEGPARGTRAIRATVFAVTWRGDELLVLEGSDDVKGDRFFRPPGGGIEFGETARTALEREMLEEFGTSVRTGRQLGVVENIFTYQGETGHEIAFLLESAFNDPSFYERDEITCFEAGWLGPAAWRPLSSFIGGTRRLVPEGLYEILSRELHGR